MSTEPRNLVELGEWSAREFQDRPCFGTKVEGRWEWMSYGDVQREVDAFRGGLAGIGIGAGDRVAIVSDNRVEWAVAAYATYGLEATFVPMYESQPVDEWEFILADSGARAVLGADARIVEALDGMRGRLPELEHVIAIEGDADDPRSFEALLAVGRRSPVPSRSPGPDAIAGFVYTSGTTGKPKGVRLSHGNFVSNVLSVLSVFPVEKEDVLLSFLPWAHVYGQVVDLHLARRVGVATAINDAIPHLLTNLEEVQPTILVAVPRIFNRIFDVVHRQMRGKPEPIRRLFESAIRNATRRRNGEHLGPGSAIGLVHVLGSSFRVPARMRRRSACLRVAGRVVTLSRPGGAASGVADRRKPGSNFRVRVLALADRLIFAKIRQRFGGRLRYVISGSAGLNPDVADFIDALGIQVYEGYGLTETSPIISANRPGARKLGTVGQPIPGVTVTIDTSKASEPDQGEIVVRGPNVMKGYHHRPEENEAVLASDGSFRTGDLGCVDADGYLRITGRLKEQYKLANGKYVMPGVLEEQLKLSPLVSNVMVHGANQPFNVAFVVPDREELTRWAKENGRPLEGLEHDEAVRRLFHGEIERHSAGFRAYERPRRFLLLDQDFTVENGLLTPTMKLRRNAVYAKYRDAIENLYTRREREGEARELPSRSL